MFALKLPSQIKAGAAETLHSEKKARGELVEIVDPTAHLAWKRNKGGPVWGPKGDAEGQQANPTPLSPSSGPGDKAGKPGWGVKTAVPIASLDPELKAQENPSPAKKTGPAWGGAGVAPAVPAEKKKDGADWADECDDDDNHKAQRPRSISTGSAPSANQLPFGGRDIDPDIIRAREMRQREMPRGSNERGGFNEEREVASTTGSAMPMSAMPANVAPWTPTGAGTARRAEALGIVIAIMVPVI